MKRIWVIALAIPVLCAWSVAGAKASLLPFDPEWTADQVRSLIIAGADVNEEDDNGWTPLMAAAMFSPRLDVIKLLIEAGANVNAEDRGRGRALEYAARRNPNVEIIRALIRADADMKSRGSSAATDLLVYWACENPNPDVIR